MISNKERREIAQSLRHCSAYGDGANLSEWWARLQEVATGEVDFPSPRELFERLADLIDRPTCKNLATHLVDELVCSACGERVDIAYLDSEDDYHVRYCPGCGAEVMG